MKEKFPLTGKKWKEVDTSGKTGSESAHDRASFVLQSGSTYDDKVEFLKEGFKKTTEARNPDFNIKKAKEAVITSVRNSWHSEKKSKRQVEKDMESDKKAFEAEGLYYKKPLRKDSEYVRGVDSELEKIINKIPEEIDAEDTGSNLERKEDDFFSAERERNSLKTVMLGSEKLTDSEVSRSLQKEYDRKEVRGSQFGSRNSEDLETRKQSQKELSSLIKEKIKSDNLSAQELVVEKEQKISAEKAKRINADENNSPNKNSSEDISPKQLAEGVDDKNDLAPESKKEVLMNSGTGRLYDIDERAKAYLPEEKQREELSKSKKLKDYQKEELKNKFRSRRYKVLKRAIEARFHKNEKIKQEELKAFEFWMDSQEKLIDEDKLAKFEDYFSYRSPRNIGGYQISEYRLYAMGEQSIRDQITEDIWKKRKKLAEAHEKMLKAEVLGDEENRVIFEAEVRDRREQLKYFSPYMIRKRMEDKVARRELSFNKWAARYDESFRPKSAFGFFRQKWNLKIYREIFNMRYWPGYIGGIALFGIAKGIDWGLNKLSGIAKELKKNKLFDFGKLNLKKIME